MLTRVLHFITNLSVGGAETMLFKLLSGFERDRFFMRAMAMMQVGGAGRKIQEIGIATHALGMARGCLQPLKLKKYLRELACFRPHVVQTWLYHADLFGGVLAYRRGIPVVWNVRHSNLTVAENKLSTVIVARLCAMLSRFVPEKIICCSKKACEIHERLGYASSKMVVIPNGFNLDAFRASMQARLLLRKELNIDPQAEIIGLVARFDVQKDHNNFFLAAQNICRKFPKVHFVLCGEGVSHQNARLVKTINGCPDYSRFHLLGQRTDIEAVQAAFDFAASSSCGEGFPNAIGEAMACEVPCIVTDVGDSSYLVGATGVVVPPRDPEALAFGMATLLSLESNERKQLGVDARKRVLENFSIQDVIQKYESVYFEVVNRSRC